MHWKCAQAISIIINETDREMRDIDVVRFEMFSRADGNERNEGNKGSESKKRNRCKKSH